MQGSRRAGRWLIGSAAAAAWLLGAACGSDGDTGTGGGGTSTGSGGGTTSASGGGGAGGGAANACFTEQGAFSTFNLKLCDPVLDECTIAVHTDDCCGTTRFVGINQNQVDLFNSCEADWVGDLDACGCAAGPSLVEQPQTGEVGSIDEVTVECMNCTGSSCICVTVPL
jgi:hypothetical protein